MYPGAASFRPRRTRHTPRTSRGRSATGQLPKNHRAPPQATKLRRGGPKLPATGRAQVGLGWSNSAQGYYFAPIARPNASKRSANRFRQDVGAEGLLEPHLVTDFSFESGQICIAAAEQHLEIGPGASRQTRGIHSRHPGHHYVNDHQIVGVVPLEDHQGSRLR